MIFNKTCPICKTDYQSEVRHQKYCSPDCAEKSRIALQNKKKSLKKNRRFAQENKQILRIKARSHSLAVETLKFYFHQEGIAWECQTCKEQNNLEVHHKDLNWLNNTPSNLTVLCTKCHAEVHATAVEDYEPSFKEFTKTLTK